MRRLGRLGRLALGASALFLATVAVLIDSPILFYMATAMIGMTAASRVQAWLSVRGLRFERIAPPAVHAGETVTVSLIVWSERRIKRPLITIEDGLPGRLIRVDQTPSLPIAPAYDQPIQSRYSFRPLRRGRYQWNKLTVVGTDALGIATMEKVYETEPAELIVYPAAIPVSVDLVPAMGWGVTEAESGNTRGAGIEPRGTREYIDGDPLRYVHWPSSARTGRLMVKEFEAGTGLGAAFVLQRTRGTAVGDRTMTTFEAMCGHTAYLAERFLRQGVRVSMPTLGLVESLGVNFEQRRREIDEALASIEPDRDESVSAELERAAALSPGSELYVLIAMADPELPEVIRGLPRSRVTCLVYDPHHYAGRSGRRPFPDAASAPAYLGELREAGAHVILMPRVGSIE